MVLCKAYSHIRSGDHFINSWLSLWIRGFLNLDISHPSSRFSPTLPFSENNSFSLNHYFRRSSGPQTLCHCCSEFISGINVLGPAAEMNILCFLACTVPLSFGIAFPHCSPCGSRLGCYNFIIGRVWASVLKPLSSLHIESLLHFFSCPAPGWILFLWRKPLGNSLSGVLRPQSYSLNFCE